MRKLYEIQISVSMIKFVGTQAGPFFRDACGCFHNKMAVLTSCVGGLRAHKA